MEPINYMALLPKVDLGREFSELGNLLALRREDLQKQKETEDSDLLQQQYLADLENARKDGSQEAWAGMIGKYPKQREALKDVAKIYGDERLNNEFKNGMEISNAFQNNAPDIAKAKLESILESYKNSGQDPGVYKTVYDNLQSGNVKDAQSMTNFALSSLFPEKFSAIAKARSEMGKLPSDIRQAEANATKAEYEAQDTPERLALSNLQSAANIRNLDSQIVDRANKFGLDKDKLQSDVQMKLYELGQKSGQLNDSSIKIVNDSAVASVAARQSASQMSDLANKLAQNGGGYGAFSTAKEWLKQAAGNENALTQLRNEYIRLKNTQALKMLPPGPASDKDIAFVMKGFLPESADAQTLANFLRGMEKIQIYTSSLEDAKSQWVNSVGHLGKPKTDIEIDGISVPAGATFSDFSAQYIDSMAKRRADDELQKTQKNIISQRSYSRYGNTQIPK